MKTTIEKTKKGIPLNIGFKEALARIILMVPAGALSVLAILYTHFILFILIPPYLLFTGLTQYGPIKHLYRLIRHKPVYTGENDPILQSEVL